MDNHPPARRRARRVAAAALAGVACASALALAQSTEQKKRTVDERLQRAEKRLNRTRTRERVLTQQVAVYQGKIRRVEARLNPLQARLSALEGEQERLEEQLRILTARLTTEKQRLAAAEDQLARRRGALSERLRHLYDTGPVDPVLVLVSSGSLTDAVEADEVMQRITDRDGNLVERTREHADEVRRARDQLQADRNEVQRAEQRTEAAADEVRDVTTALEKSRAELDAVRDKRQALLDSVQGDRAEIEAETEDLRARSAALAAKIVEAQTGSRVPASVVRSASSAGMIWPVNGTFTSGFGPRWGRMHEGIDIAVPTGTPVAAAASGTVISSGWGGGYGNLVVIDHGGGVATAYAHNTRLIVSSGQAVGQGSIIAYAGSTGNSTGPHVHFEVRINGQATDPLPYL